jgi:secondary thiamine-phosphate synthase enzyme
MQSEFHIRSHRKYEMLDITGRVADIVRQSQAAEGICSVYVTHATAAIVINENYDPNVCEDVLDALGKLIPEGVWRHDRVDNNAAAHIKSAILGPGETVPVREGKLVLGTWQAIMLVELDGPRDRRVVVTVR